MAVDMLRPPMTAIASGLWSSAPAPGLRLSGSRTKSVHSVGTTIGRKRVVPAATGAASATGIIYLEPDHEHQSPERSTSAGHRASTSPIPSSPLIVAPIGPAVVQPFAADFGASGGDYVVPAGKQAVVELITFDNWQQDTGLYKLLVSLTVNAKFIEFRLGPTFVQPYKPTNSLRYYGVHSLRLYADPGSTIHVGGNGVIGQGGVTISGHLIDHP